MWADRKLRLDKITGIAWLISSRGVTRSVVPLKLLFDLLLFAYKAIRLSATVVVCVVVFCARTLLFVAVIVCFVVPVDLVTVVASPPPASPDPC